MQRLTRCVWIVVAIAGTVPRGAFAQKALTWQQVKRPVRSHESNPSGRPHRHRRGESPGNHRLSASQSGHDDDVRSDRPLQRQPLSPVWERPAVGLGQLSPRARRQAGVAAGECAEGHGGRGVSIGGPGENSSVQPPQCVRAGAAAKVGGGAGHREPRVLRPAAGGEQRAIQSGRYCAGRSGPPGTAARAVRNRFAVRAGEPENRRRFSC